MGEVTTLVKLKELVSMLGSVEFLAEQFCELDDDAQAQFFVHVARIMATWKGETFGNSAAEVQAFFIGRHLATCECSTEVARELVRGIHRAMESEDG